MTLFLTSSLRNEDGTALNPANGFVDELRVLLPEAIRVLYVCSDPEAAEITDFYAEEIFACIERAGFTLASAVVLDPRTDANAAVWVANADLIILAGGHVPTQNAYFRRIGLAALLQKRRFDSCVVVGTSAGSMNCARVVYAQPEFDGEASSPNYRRFIPGLGLTEINIIPHLSELRDMRIDGLRVIDDIALPDSVGREFIAMSDGSYVLIRELESGQPEIRGEAFLLKDGEIRNRWTNIS